MDHDITASEPTSIDERVEDFAEFLDQMEEADPEPDAGEEEETVPAVEEQPAAEVTAPVSWDKDAKALFEQLPPELQEQVATREAQRERALQGASQAAAEARRHAAAEASAAFADQQRAYAHHLQQLAAQVAPQRPDPALLAQDPQAFYRAQAQYEAQTARAQSMAQAAAIAHAEAQQRDAIAHGHALEQDHAALTQAFGDEWVDGGKRQALLEQLEEVGETLGYSRALMGQAGPQDVLALKAAAEWKAKADRYDALQSGRAGVVKAARAAPRMAKPGTTPSRAEQTGRGRDAAWTRAKSERSGAAYAALLDSMGITL